MTGPAARGQEPMSQDGVGPMPHQRGPRGPSLAPAPELCFDCDRPARVGPAPFDYPLVTGRGPGARDSRRGRHGAARGRPRRISNVLLRAFALRGAARRFAERDSHRLRAFRSDRPGAVDRRFRRFQLRSRRFRCFRRDPTGRAVHADFRRARPLPERNLLRSKFAPVRAHADRGRAAFRSPRTIIASECSHGSPGGDRGSRSHHA